MSKRLQVMIPDEQYKLLSKTARRKRVAISQLVRESIRLGLLRGQPRSDEDKLDSILRYARFTGPTADIEEMLSQIERGREER